MDTVQSIFWEDIKKMSWDKFPDRQVFIDDDNCFFAMNRKNNELMVAGYVFVMWDPSEDTIIKKLIKSLSDLLDFAKHKYPTSDIVFITNYQLADLKTSLIEYFPDDVKYFLFKNNQFQKLDIAVIKKIVLEKVKLLIDKKLHKEDYIIDTGPDEEAKIMRAIRDGYGDLYGYG